MSLAKEFETIESLDFIVQFSVLSGFTLVLRAFANDATIEALRSKLSARPDACQSVATRIGRILTTSDVELYDESIAAYLFCLWKADLPLAHKASEGILETGGLWWSIQLAQHIMETTETEAA